MIIFMDQVMILGELLLRVFLTVIGAFALWAYITWRL